MERPTGVTIIALFEFFIASLLILFAVASALGVSALGAIQGSNQKDRYSRRCGFCGCWNDSGSYFALASLLVWCVRLRPLESQDLVCCGISASPT